MKVNQKIDRMVKGKEIEHRRKGRCSNEEQVLGAKKEDCPSSDEGLDRVDADAAGRKSCKKEGKSSKGHTGANKKRCKRRSAYNLFQKWYMAEARKVGKRPRKLCSPEDAAEMRKAWEELDDMGRKKFEDEAKAVNAEVDAARASSENGTIQTNKDTVTYYSRCCPQQVTRFISQLGKRCHVRELIKEMGFETFSRIRCGNMPKSFIIKLLGHFNPFTCELVVRGKCQKISGEDVADLMGVPNGVEPVRSCVLGEEEVGKRFVDLACFLAAKQTKEEGETSGVSEKKIVRKANFKTLKIVLSSNRVDDTILKQAFLLLAFGSVLCPTSSQVPSPKLYSAVADVTNVKKFRWGDFVLGWLCEEACAFIKGKGKRVEKGGKRSVGGCLVFLMLFYFERFSFWNVEERARDEHPLDFWTFQRVWRRVQMEIDYAKFNTVEGIGNAGIWKSIGAESDKTKGIPNNKEEVDGGVEQIAKVLMDYSKQVKELAESLIGRKKRKRKSWAQEKSAGGRDAKMGKSENAEDGKGFALDAESVHDEVFENEKGSSKEKCSASEGCKDGSENKTGGSCDESGKKRGDELSEVKIARKDHPQCNHSLEDSHSQSEYNIANSFKEDNVVEIVDDPTSSSPLMSKKKTMSHKDKADSEGASGPRTRAWHRKQMNRQVYLEIPRSSREKHALRNRKRRVVKPSIVANSSDFAVQTLVPNRRFTQSDTVRYIWCTNSRVRRGEANELVISIGDEIALYRHELRCMGPRQRVSNVVVEFFARLLNRRQKQAGRVRKHYFSPIFSASIVAAAGGDPAQKVRGKKWIPKLDRRHFCPESIGYSLLTCDMVFIPILYKEHWFLFVVNIRDQRVDILDSHIDAWQTERNLLAREVVLVMSAALSFICGKDYSISNFLRNEVAVPQQETTYDCGIFLMKFMEAWDGLKMIEFDAKAHIPAFRKQFVLDWIGDPENDVPVDVSKGASAK